MELSIHIRPEQSGDEAAIVRVNDEAFGQAEESRLVTAIRRAGRPTISLVAIHDQRIVGHILFTPVTIEPVESTVRAMGLGPMAVVPERQRQGIGSRLVAAGLAECARIGCHVVVVVGHPSYYPRFGFGPARALGLRCAFAVPDEVFMALELAPGALTPRGGTAHYVPEFGAA